MSAGAGFAALPMYDWPEVRAEVDREWAALRARLLAAGIAAPEGLVRRNAELPPVPGGIRNVDGSVVAPDPAMLPPDEFDLPALWRHPALLLAQTCWGPMEQGLAADIQVVGQPDYSRFEGGEEEFYSSAILARRALEPVAGIGAEVEGKQPSPGVAAIVELLRGKRLAFNSPDSMSGIIALRRDLEAVGEGLSLFSELLETGAHRASITAVAEGRADVCAVDCRTWDLAKRFEPAALELAVVGWTAKRKGLPFITSRLTPPETVAALREALTAP